MCACTSESDYHADMAHGLAILEPGTACCTLLRAECVWAWPSMSQQGVAIRFLLRDKNCASQTRSLGLQPADCSRLQRA